MIKQELCNTSAKLNYSIDYQIPRLNKTALSTDSLSMGTTILNVWTFRDLRRILSGRHLALYLTFLSTPCAGESTNKRMIIPGARAQAVSGAFTAVANDASAGWHNPAGLGFLKGPGVSASVNNYSVSKKTVQGVASNVELGENSSSIYPGFAGVNTTLGPLSVGWSYFTMDEQNTDESQSIQIDSPAALQAEVPLPLAAAGFRYDRIQLTSGNLIHAGASLALPIGKNISLGISEFYYRRQKQTNLKERSTFTSGVFYDSFSRVSTKNEGTIAIAGALVRSGAFSMGVSVRIPRALSDKTDYETSQVIYTGTAPELASQSISTHREDELTTRTWNLGIAWTPTDHATVSADVVHYPATKTLWAGSGGFDTRATTDWSFGAELRSDSLVVAGGAFTNSSLVRKPIPSLVWSDPSQINFVGFSIGVGLKTRQSENLFIMTRQQGRGYTQMVQGDLTLQDVTIETQTFSLSSSYKF